jgi:predicted Zn-dependent peptidase
MKRKIRCAVGLCIALAAWPDAWAARQSESARAADLPRLHVAFERTRLKNGLELITVEDHRTPIVSVVQVFNVGAADEAPGHTGFAHLFEHLMFQGSANVGSGEHIKQVESYGGFSNATTGTDWTAYFDSVPANQLDFALFINGDRLRSLQISAENLGKEREVVKEEKRLRFDNQAYRNSAFILDELLYDSFAYEHNGVGSMEDLSTASLEDVRRFFDTHYTASNLTLVVVGDFDRKTIRGKVEQYFGDLPLRPRPPPAKIDEPRQRAERRRTVIDPLAPLPQLSIAFKAVPGDSPDYFALTVLSSVLQDGHSSRLYHALVEAGLASDVGGYMSERRGPGALYVEATLQPAGRVAEVEQAIYGEVERLQREAVADWELTKAKSSLATAYLDRLNRGMLRGFAIAQYCAEFDDPQRVNTYLNLIAAVTAQDVRRVAKAYLRPDNRSVLLTQPGSATETSK